MSQQRLLENAPSVSHPARYHGDVGRRSRLVFRALACFLSFAAVFATLESSIRFLYRRPAYAEKLIHVRSTDPVLLYEMRPNARTSLWDVPVETNSLGHRGDEPGDGQPRPVQQRRILVIGDSTAFGWGVRVQDAFPQRMQQLLNSSVAANRSYVVFNLAVVGYNTTQEIRALKVKGLPLDPYLAFVAYSLNDPDMFTGDHVRHFHPPLFETIYYTGRAIDKLRQWWSGMDYPHYVHYRYRDEVRRNFEELGNISRSTRLPVVLVVIPFFHWRGERYQYHDIHRFLAEEALRNDLLFIDLWEDFKERVPRDVTLDGWHPNQAGHEVIARRLAEFALKTPDLVS